MPGYNLVARKRCFSQGRVAMAESHGGGLSANHLSSEVRRRSRAPCWTATEDNLIVTAKKAGKTSQSIHLELLPRRSVHSIARRLQQLNNGYSSTTAWQSSDCDKVAEMRRAGKTFTSICREEFPASSPQTLRAVLHRWSTRPIARRMSKSELDKERDMIKALRQQGKTTEEIRDLAFPDRSAQFVEHQIVMMTRDPERKASKSQALVTANELQAIEDMHKSGLRPAQIVSATGRAMSTVIRKLHQLGLTPHSTPLGPRIVWTKAEDDLLTSVKHKKLSSADKQALFPHRSLQSTNSRLAILRKAAGLGQRRQEWSAEQDADIMQLRRKGLTVEGIPSKLGRRYWSIANRLRFLGTVQMLLNEVIAQHLASIEIVLSEEARSRTVIAKQRLCIEGLRLSGLPRMGTV
jgi:hypothetical protein